MSPHTRVVAGQFGVPRVAGELGVRDLASRLLSEVADTGLSEELLVESGSTLVRLVNKIFLDAIEDGASDIHFESNPGRQDMRVRFRKDGVLMHYLDIPQRFRSAVVSRIKIMSQLDITERRKPQDGKIDFSKHGAAKFELRVAVIPTRDGMEDLVLRVLAGSSPVELGRLGLDPQMLESLRRMIARPQGLFLVCGPTGSGKTTTLHSVMAELDNAERKIWTAEDPIEITQPGLRQVQVNPRIGWTFAAALRSFLRADPDVIMVGEMRDFETAKIGIEASLTGHMVFSTLHTNSAPDSIVRLLDFGLDPFNFSDALTGILSQRLARCLCEQCRSPYFASQAELMELLAEYCSDTASDPQATLASWRKAHGHPERGIRLFRAAGCAACSGRGYLGRIGVYELMPADADIKRLILRRASIPEVKAAAMHAGMRTLKQDGIDKVLQGWTDIHQIRAACG